MFKGEIVRVSELHCNLSPGCLGFFIFLFFDKSSVTLLYNRCFIY